jgi:peroxisomal enoyl-CoA hydratase 2
MARRLPQVKVLRILLVQDLKGSHIAQYAGASGDYNLVHVDEDFAITRAGYPSVIAHGMLTMGLTATFLTSIIDAGTLRKFGGRFLAPVLPGDSLRCVATVHRGRQANGVGKPVGISCETLRLGDGAAVFRGRATFMASDSIRAREKAPTIQKGNSL